MKTIDDLKQERHEAGVAYAAAARAYVDTWIELNAYDLALENQIRQPLPSFHGSVPAAAKHPEFLRDVIGAGAPTKAHARHEEILNELD